MDINEKLLSWAVELQALAQAGLYYSKDRFDIERFERIREISAEMMAEKCELPLEKVKSLFCNDVGYQTPKIDTRAAIFEDDKILLVREADGKWSLPGGWCDVYLSVKENTIKEVREEAGLKAVAEKLVCVHYKDKHNEIDGHKICKFFTICRSLGGEFVPNIETTESCYFALDELPVLSEGKNTREQIELCFKAAKAEHWETVFD